MEKKKLLFVCTYNQWRSLTAEIIFKNHPEFSVRSAGTSPNARHPISNRDLDWADLVLCMEDRHREIIKDKFKQSLPPITVLDIASGYRYMEPELIALLKQKIEEIFPKSKN